MFDRALAARLRHYATLKDRDPLAYWHHQSEESRLACRMLSAAEVYCRWPNWTGKTTFGAAAVVSMLQGRDELDGIPLPRVRKPSAAVLSLDYEQQTWSVQPAYLAAVGDWPHKATWKGDGILSTLRIKPLTHGGDDPDGWPMAKFVSQENRKSGTGARVPIIHADEPPREEIWREFRKGKRYGDDRSVRLITATPLVRSQWSWLRDDYEGCEGVPHEGRIEIHMPDVRRCRLVAPDWPRDTSDSERYRELLEEYRGDKRIKARLTAEYVDIETDNPYDGLLDVLEEMLAASRTPVLREWPITREVDGAEGRAKKVEKVTVEVYADAVPGRRYYIPGDPSLGIDSVRHDPGGLHVRDVETGDLMVRYNGYIGSYGLGTLAAGVARQYNNARVSPETTGGYGGPFLTALADCGYHNIAQQKVELRPGEWRTQLGFQTTTQTRPGYFAATQEWLKAWRAGYKYASCPSREILKSMIDLHIDGNGKPLAAPGLHDEDAILWGHGLAVLQPPRHRIEPKVVQPRIPQTMAELRAVRQGRHPDHRPTAPRMRVR